MPRSEQNLSSSNPSKPNNEPGKSDFERYTKPSKEFERHTKPSKDFERHTKKPKDAEEVKKATKKPKSEKRFSSSQQQKFSRDCKNIKTLMSSSDKNLWTLGDMCAATIDWYAKVKGVKPQTATDSVASEVGVTRQRIGQYVHTARFFPKGTRSSKASFFTHEKARRVNDKTLEIHRRSTAQEIVDAMNAGAFTTREITKWIKKKQEQQLAKNSRNRAKIWQPKTSGIINNLHAMEWEQRVEDMADGMIDGSVWADPPFGVYDREAEAQRIIKNEGGRYLLTCHNADEDSARATTLRLFDLLPRVMAPGVPLFLHQHGGSIDDPELIMYALERGWHFHCPITWLKAAVREDGVVSGKGAAAPNYMGDAFAPNSQRILVATHGTKDLFMVGCKGNQNVRWDTANFQLVVAPNMSRRYATFIARQKAMSEDHHGFEHPVSIAVDVLNNVLAPNSKQIVFEPFGCTAPASVAAIRMGWDWIYCEAHEKNYKLGLQRISEAMEDKPKGTNDQKEGQKSEQLAA